MSSQGVFGFASEGVKCQAFGLAGAEAAAAWRLRQVDRASTGA